MVFPGETPTKKQLQAVQSIAAFEGGYGRAWHDHVYEATGFMTNMEGSNNWGAVQCQNCKPEDGVCCDGCGYWYDSHPSANGPVYYEQCFRRYDTPAEGAAAILQLFTHMKGVLAVLPTGDIDKIAWAMRQAHYYEGFSTDPQEAADTYAATMYKCAQGTAEALGEPLEVFRGGMDNAVNGTDTTALDPNAPASSVALDVAKTTGKIILGLGAAGLVVLGVHHGYKKYRETRPLSGRRPLPPA
jgi:hypothetical protein